MSLGLQEKTHILVCNKIDNCEEMPIFSATLQYQHKCYISCKTGEGIEQLLDELKRLATSETIILNLYLPFDQSQGQKLALAHQYGQVLSEQYDETGAIVEVQLSMPDAKKYFWEFLPEELKNEVKW